MGKKGLSIGAVVISLLGAGIACTRAEVPPEEYFIPPAAEVMEEEILEEIVDEGAKPIPTEFIEPTEIPPTPTSTEIPPTPIPTDIPPTPTPTEEPLPQELLDWQAACYEPGQCGYLLEDLRWRHYEDDWAVYGVSEFAASPLRSLDNMAGDCEDAVMLLAAGLLDDGYLPYALILATDHKTHANNHTIYPYQEDGLWGYVNINRRNLEATDIGLRVVDVQPQFESLQSLFDYYRTTFDWATPYTRYFLVNLEAHENWLTTDEHIEFRYAIANNVDGLDDGVPAEPGDSD